MMDTRHLKRSMVAAFALAGALAAGGACSSASSNAAAAPQAGDTLADGTIYAGNNFAATPADAPGLYTWVAGKRYCEDLNANGHDDWTLPALPQLDQLYRNKNTGSFAGTFNESTSLAGVYWSSEELDIFFSPSNKVWDIQRDKPPVSDSPLAWIQRFTDGYVVWIVKDNVELSVRCVRAELRP
jgi:hypothetical protein